MLVRGFVFCGVVEDVIKFRRWESGDEAAGLLKMCRDSKGARFVAVHFEEFDFQHQFAGGPVQGLEAVSHASARCSGVSRMVDGGMRASRSLRVLAPVMVLQDASIRLHLRDDGRRGSGESLIGFKTVLPCASMCVWSEKKHVGFQGPQKVPCAARTRAS